MTTVLLGKLPDSQERASFLVTDDASPARLHTHTHTHARTCWKVPAAVAVLVIGAGLLALEVYQAREASAIRLQVDLLKKEVDDLKHRLLEEDLLSELKAFQAAVYAEEANEGDDDEYDYVQQEDPVSLSDPYTRKHNSKYEEEQRDEGEEEEEEEEESNDQDTDKGDAGQSHNPHKKESRPKRDTVPVVAGSYGVSNQTEGLRLYEALVANPQQPPTDRATDPPAKHHHRISSWPSKSRRKKYQHASKDDAAKLEATSPIISRPSRVMQTDVDPARRVDSNVPPAVVDRSHKKHEGQIRVRVYQEHRAPAPATVRAMPVRARKPSRRLSSVSDVERPTQVRHRLLPAAHYDGDSTHYSAQHEHYDGNGRLRHPDGVFADWTASRWVQQLGMERHFSLDSGVVTLHDTGLYFVYAQVHYLDEHDINGFRVYVNEEPLLQCTTMTHSSGREPERIKKSNTCFTGGALFLRENDQLSLRDIGGLRYSLFQTGKSFFGLIKLGSVNIK